MQFRILAMVAATVALTTNVQAQGFFLSTTLDGSGTACIEPPNTFPSVVTLYVLFNREMEDGLTGAEFSIRGLDEGPAPAQPYFTQWTPSWLSNISLGDPFAEGVNVAFPTCQTADIVLLGTVTIFNQGDTELRQLRIEARQPPFNPNFDCSLFTHCDEPYYSIECAPGGGAYLNISRDPQPATHPDPPDGATDVPLQVTLRWYIPPIPQETCEPGTIFMNIHFGTDPNPPYLNSSTGPRQWVLPLLQPETTYYWRISVGTPTSPVWSFTTGSTVGVETTNWGRVRSFFR